uniref:T-cell surface glycoprotein CD3 zeta chain n=1 Tax=Equus asinus asinus TaxID=83772 RepID=A0A8C4MKZ8_EQUAS
MKWKALMIAAILQAQFPVTDAQSYGLLDPKLCYVLDGILFIYGVIVTALFLRMKFGRRADAPAEPQGGGLLYQELNLGRREEYDGIADKRRARDPEMGGKQQRRKNPQEVVYNSLQKDKMAEAYSEIRVKGEVSAALFNSQGLGGGCSREVPHGLPTRLPWASIRPSLLPPAEAQVAAARGRG